MRTECSSPGDMCQKKGKDEEEHRHAREGPRKSPFAGCVKNSSDAQPAWRRVSMAIDSGACDCVISPEHVPDHEVHESVESGAVRTFNLIPARANSQFGRPAVAAVQEGSEQSEAWS